MVAARSSRPPRRGSRPSPGAGPETRGAGGAGSLPGGQIEEAFELADAVRRLSSKKRTYQALKLCDEMIARWPAVHLGHISKGGVLDDAGRPEDALASLARASALVPDDRTAYCMRAEILIRVRRHEAALTDIERAAHHDRESYFRNQLTLMGAYCLLELGRLDEAEALCATAPDDAVCFALDCCGRGTLLREIRRRRGDAES